jgi:hypothetical protein
MAGSKSKPIRSKQITDISATLGKVPPQVPELERAVLAAILTEAPAIGRVANILTVDHFYTDAHQRIYEAALRLHREGHPVDLKTVLVELRRTGHLELVGGATYLAQLSAEISSSAHLEYHARVVIEMALKRQLIVLASLMHQEGYQDDSDVFEIIEKVRTQVEQLTVTIKPSVKDQLAELWKKVEVVDRPPDRVALITLHNCVIATRGNHSLLTGKKKARKSLMVVHLVSLAVQQRAISPEQIVVFDTEQEKLDVWEMREKVRRITGKSVSFYSLRGMHYKERREFIDGTCQHRPVRPVLAVIDGVRDLLSDINDMNETIEVVSLIERLTTEHNMHIIDVLHLNKTDGNARGHLGTELTNKSEMNIELNYMEDTGLTEVKCESARRQSFSPFMFCHSKEGLPEVVGQVIGGEVVAEDDSRSTLLLIYEDGTPLRYNELIDEVKTYFKVGTNKAKQLIGDFRRKGWLVRSGPARSKDTVYKIMITPGGPDPEPMAEEVQVDMFSSNGHPLPEPPPMDLPPPEEPPWIEEELEL